MTRAGHRKDRRGVLLLIILGLLAMFGLVAIAFVVLTGQAKRASIAASKYEQTMSSPERDLHAAAMQVLRGTLNPRSVLQVHSLLEDLYGDDDVEPGQMSGAAAAGSGSINQLIEVTFTPASGTQVYSLAGRVLTVLSGPAQGLSTHIVGYNPTNQKIQIRAFKEVSVSLLTGTYRCVVNGAPFSGLGFGFLSGGMGNGALKPNGDPDTQLGTSGGANEGYDAVDFQNMLLALTVPIPLAYPNSIGSVTNHAIPVPIPSLHRPSLINYWQNQGSLTQSLLRQVMLRPMGPSSLTSALGFTADHPNFTGSNPYFDPTWNGMYGTNNNGVAYGSNTCWDVDNDGDGIPDSIWVDLGMPIRQAPDGRLYKPLCAILCVDMDGRLNLNAHGFLAQTDPMYYATPANTGTDVPGGSARFFNGAGAGSTQLQLARGLGSGPADTNLLPGLVDLEKLLTGTLSSTDYIAYCTYYQNLLGGRNDPFTGEPLDGRYGEGVHSGSGGWPFASGWPFPGFTGTVDRLWFNQHFDYPDDYYSAPRGYGAPPDLRGMMCVGLDLRGQPLYAMMGGHSSGASRDTPYEINLSRGAARGLPANAPIDNAFTAAEFERLARAFDVDAAALPRRLFSLTYDGTAGTSLLVSRRHEIAPESWDLPGPTIPFDLDSPNSASARPGSMVDFLRKAFNFPQDSTNSQMQALLRGKLVAPELLAGLRMNLNRPWGNGLDDNSNNVIDEPQEASSETVPQVNASGTTLSPTLNHTNGIDVNGDGSVNGTDRQLARQLYARHLYMLMLAVVDVDYLKTLSSDADVYRMLAQWAVNVVDFRDADSIMTCFEYDPDPLSSTGWRPDGDPTTDDGITENHVVWGCERPELLLTESIALHNRKLEDLEIEVPDGGGNPGKTTDTNDPDLDFDQRLRPQGSLFLEFYNPWSTYEPLPMELYANSAAGYGVDLTKTTTGGAPVWRVAIVAYDDSVAADDPQPDLNDPDETERPDIERSVYFADPSGATIADHGEAYYPSGTYPIAPVLPGRYAVVGPGEPSSTGATNPTTTYLSIKSGAPMQVTESEPDTDAPRSIVLNPSADPSTTGQVEFSVNGAYTLPWSNIQPPVAVVIDAPHRLSVTEPTETDGYYETNGPTGVAYSEKDGGYATDQAIATPGKPFDEPLDQRHDGDTGLWATLQEDGVTSHFKVVHLQRLANPLQAYNAKSNPYITVDSMAIDLTTFNGVEDDSSQQGGNVDKLVTRERGEHNDTTNPGNLWPHEPEDEDATGPTDYAGQSDLTGYHFNKLLGHSLGFLNRRLNNNNAPRDGSASAAMYKGDPQDPFPWLTWLNRPFVSPAELMLVPSGRMSRLLHSYHLVKSGTIDPYEESAYGSEYETNKDKVHFRHLLNFFHSDDTPASGGTADGPMLHRLLDFVGVPSPFVGTEVQVPPGAWAGTMNAGHFLYPPFNRIPLYREPGRVNLNTMISPAVGAGLVNFFPGLWEMSLWEKFNRSRQGYSTVATADPGSDAAWAVAIQESMLKLDASYPTRFANPFRSFAGGKLAPLASMERPEIEATLLRPAPDSPTRPLFEHHPSDTQLQENCRVDKNPYFRYQGFQRLGNLVTTRSNVYAVWITVGYFEVEPLAVPYDANVYPDGARLGRELGIDTGEVKRHRAFYMIDRSIPVGFQRGEDFNVEKAVLLKRFIE